MEALFTAITYREVYVGLVNMEGDTVSSFNVLQIFVSNINERTAAYLFFSLFYPVSLAVDGLSSIRLSH